MIALAGKHRCLIRIEFQSNCQKPTSFKTWKVLDPRVASDATMVIETGSRSIDFARQCCEELKIPFPDQIVIHVNSATNLAWFFCKLFTFYVPHVLHSLHDSFICHSKGCPVLFNVCVRLANTLPSRCVGSQADNCVRETKNGHLLRFLSWLCSSGRIRLGALLFGRVGHTHGCLGCSAKFWNYTISNLREGKWQHWNLEF